MFSIPLSELSDDTIFYLHKNLTNELKNRQNNFPPMLAEEFDIDSKISSIRLYRERINCGVKQAMNSYEIYKALNY